MDFDLQEVKEVLYAPVRFAISSVPAFWILPLILHLQ